MSMDAGITVLASSADASSFTTGRSSEHIRVTMISTERPIVGCLCGNWSRLRDSLAPSESARENWGCAHDEGRNLRSREHCGPNVRQPAT
jgi:hypothetical protein